MLDLTAKTPRLIFASLALTLVPSYTVLAQANFFNGFERPVAADVCNGATSVTLGALQEGAIDPAGQRDRFRFSAQANDYLLINTTANAGGDPDLLDTVLSLHTSEGDHHVAQNDDDVLFGMGRDSLLIYRSPTASSYCLQLEDFSTYNRETPPRGGPTFVYDLLVTPLDFNTAGNNRGTEPNDGAGQAQVASVFTSFSNVSSALLTGLFDAHADVDVYRITTSALTQASEVVFSPHGTTGFGSSVRLGLIDVLAPNGSTVLARLNPSFGSRAIYLPVQGLTDYFVVVRSVGQPLGANPFYAVRWIGYPNQNPQEMNDVGNNLSITAEAASPISVENGRQYFLGGTLSATDDVDWWSFQGIAGELIRLDCRSRRDGSGVLDMNFRVFRDPIQPPLQQEVETEAADVRWTDQSGASRPAVPVTMSGTYYLRISASLFDSIANDRHYRCGVNVGI